MRKSFFASKSRFFSWVKRWLHAGIGPARKDLRRRAPLLLEHLEDRLTPASLTDSAGTLTIVLDNPGETLTINATGSNQYNVSSTAGVFDAGLSGAMFSSGTLTVNNDTSIQIIDTTSGTGVTFADSGPTNSYDQPVTVNLSNILSGDINFNGTSTFTSGLTVSTANGNIASSMNSKINVSSGSLMMTAKGTIELLGSVDVASVSSGFTTFQAEGQDVNGKSIAASNSANVFAAGLAVFGGSNFAQTPGSAAIAASGALLIDQADIGGSLTVTAGGSITLSNPVNNIGGDFSPSVTGSSNIELDTDGNITLGTVSLGTGSLTLGLDGSIGDISEDPAGGITTATGSAGSITVNANGSQNNVDLTGAANNIQPGMTIVLNGFFSFTPDDFGLRNINAGASPAQIQVNGFNVGNLTLLFDHAAIDVATLPSFSGLLTASAGGDITQSAPVILNGTGQSFTSTGGNITLDGGGGMNQISGPVSASVTGSHNITIENSLPEFSLGNISLGSGTLTLTDDDSNGFSAIDQVANTGINGGTNNNVISPTTATVKIDIASDTSVNINLSGSNNDLGSGATLTVNGVSPGNGGPTSGDFSFTNKDTNATLTQLTLTNFTVNNLTLDFSQAALNASQVATTIPATRNVTLTAGGDITQPTGISVTGDLSETSGGNITQGTGVAGAITVTGAATFSVTGNSGSITLNNPNNSVSGPVSFNAPATDATGNVAFTNSSDVVLGDSALGTGTFSITAGGTGNIDGTGATITQPAQINGLPAPAAGTATFTAGGTSIDLEGFQNYFTGTVKFVDSNAGPVTVSLENSNPQATLASVDVSGVSNLGTLNLIFDGNTASILLPTTSVGYSLSLTETNNIVLPLNSTITVTGGNNLSLESMAGNIDLLGAVNVSGTTTLTTDGNGSTSAITASNTGNNFGTQLNITNSGNSATTIVSGTTLTLGDVTAFGNLSATATTGSILQANGTTLNVFNGSSTFTATGGSVTLNGTLNMLIGAVSASVGGSGSIILDNSTATVVGGITLGTGNLTVNSSSTISEQGGAGITTAGNSTATLAFTITNDTSGGVDLSEGANNFIPGVSISVTGAPSTGDFGLRNTNPAASFAQVSFHSFTINSLTVRFDHTSINVDNLPAFSNTGDLTLSAGGNITQSTKAIVTSGAASFSAQGNGAILLSNTGNTISGTVSFSNPGADNKHNVSFANHGSITLGDSSLGLGTFSLTAAVNGADAGNIIGVGAVTQARGGAAVTFTAAGPSIMLDITTGDDFSGPVTLAGSGAPLTDVAFANANPLATIPTITGAASSFTSYTVNLSQAPVLLGNISTGMLNISAGGNISQAANTKLTVTGEATLSAEISNMGNTEGFSIVLANPDNSIHEIALSNSGQNPVTVNTTGPLVIDSSNLGSGPLTITAQGAITETGNSGGIVQTLGQHDQVAGLISLSSGANNPILLDNPSNTLLGPIAVNTTGSVAAAVVAAAAGNVTIVNSTTTILANDNVSGGLSVTAANPLSSFFISQAPGTTFNVSGNIYLSADAGIDLTDPGNGVGSNSMVSLQTGTFGSAALAVTTGGVQLAASSVGGELDLTAKGDITQLSGTSGATNGVITAKGASFTSTNGNINLINPGNDFQGSAVSLNAADNVSLTDSDTGGLTLGNVKFGGTLGGTLSLTVSGNLSQQSGTAITGTGSGTPSVTVTNSSNVAANAVNVDLSEAGNNITGSASFALSNVGTVTLANMGDIKLTAGSTIVSTGDVTLTAGGAVTLPTGNSNTLILDSLTVTANNTTVSQNLTITGGSLSFTGAVNFTAPVIVNTSGVVQIGVGLGGGTVAFNGNVDAAQALTFDLPDSGEIDLNAGTWNQHANNLTINGTQATFNIGTFGSGPSTTFSMSGGMLAMTGIMPGDGTPSSNNNINVNGTFQVGDAVTLSDGGNDSIVSLNFKTGSIFLVGLGVTPGVLTFNGTNASDAVNISPGSTLSGFGGVAPSSSTTILAITGGGSIAGTFSNPQDASGNFFMGTDIVQATYNPDGTTLAIQQSGTTATSVSGTERDGDQYTIAVTGGSGLVVIDASGGSVQGLEVVVRNASAATALTITTIPNGGDGLTQVLDIAIDGPGAATITGLKTDVSGNITVGGPLAALTLHDFNNGTLSARSSNSVSTTIAGNVFAGDTINLGTTLKTLTLAAFTGNFGMPTPITASSFGTITINGNAAINTPGNFFANLIDTNTSGVAVGTATIKGTLGGNWELAGSVGMVTAAITDGWTLGTPNGPGIVNAGGLTGVTSLSLGTAADVTVNATGNVGTLTAISLDDSSAGFLQANAFTTITMTGSPAKGPTTQDHGNLNADITATGSAAGTAIGTLKVAGNMGQPSFSGPPMLITVASGNIGTITVGGIVKNVQIQAPAAAIGTITVGQWTNSDLNAKSITTWKIVGNLGAQIFGSFSGGSVTLTGAGTAAALGTFSTTSDLNSAEFTIVSGGVGSFTVGGEMASMSLMLQSPTNGSLGTITAAQWSGDDVSARTIGTLKSTARAAALAASAAFNGDISDSAITAFQPISAATPGIGTFFAAGTLSGLSNAYVIANGGIGSFTVGRSVESEQISANVNGGNGGIATLTAGAWNSSDIAAAFLGNVKITGFATPEQRTASVNGDFSGSNVVLTGASTGKGIGTMAVSHDMGDQQSGFDAFNVPFGIGALTVGGTINGALGLPTFDLLNPSTSANSAATSGILGTLKAGEMEDVTLYANAVGTPGTQPGGIQVTGSAALGLAGDFNFSNLDIAGFMGTADAPVGLTSLSVAGNMIGTTINVRDGINALTVTQQVASSPMAAAFGANATIKSITVASWVDSNITANSIGTFTAKGYAAGFIPGNVTNDTINLLASTGGAAATALGTFSATGKVQNTQIQITSGNVNSFQSAYFLSSSLFVGYAIVDLTDITDVSNNQQPANGSIPGNWEGTFTLGSFKTTGALTSNVANSAGFQTADVVAAKLGTGKPKTIAVALSGLNQNPLAGSGITAFGIGFRSNGGLAGTLTIAGVSVSQNASIGSFHYLGLAG